MNMLDILKERLPENLSIVSYKEKPSKFLVLFDYRGDRFNGEVPKTCTPGRESEVCDFSIQTAMTTMCLNKGDLEEVMKWKDYAKTAKKTGSVKGVSRGVYTGEELENRLLRYCEKEGITKDEAYCRGIELLLQQRGEDSVKHARKDETKTATEQRLLDELKAAEEENKTLVSCLESVSRYEKDQHEFELKVAKDIVERDKKAVANIILNMTFGKHYVSFCEIFGLKETGGCERNEHCTDCIFSWLQDYFALTF